MMRPAPLLEVLPQVRVLRHTVEQRIEHTPYVQILDAPVPQMVEQLVDFFKSNGSRKENEGARRRVVGSGGACSF